MYRGKFILNYFNFIFFYGISSPFGFITFKNNIMQFILSPIHSFPYTFFPHVKSSISFNTPKESHAPFLGGKDPQRRPF